MVRVGRVELPWDETRQILSLLCIPIPPYPRKMVRAGRLELPWDETRRILSPLRLPIPPCPQNGSGARIRTANRSVNSRLHYRCATPE